jgi:tight adherence protein B
MIPLALSITFGAGVYLIYEGLTAPRRPTGEGWWRRPVEGALARAGLSGAAPQDLLLASCCAAIVAAAPTQLALGWTVVSLLAGALGAMAPIAYLVRRHDRRRAEVQTAMVGAIGQLRDAIRTGLSVPDAFVGLARGGPAVLRPELTTLVREMRLIGFEPAIGAMRDRLADPLFDVVAASLVLNDRLGGRNVSQVLDRLAHATRAQLRIQDELRALQARNVLSARIVAAIPLVVLVVIRQLNPTYLSIFSDWWGQVLLAACLLSIFVGYVGMRWMTRLPTERRVLR